MYDFFIISLYFIFYFNGLLISELDSLTYQYLFYCYLRKKIDIQSKNRLIQTVQSDPLFVSLFKARASISPPKLESWKVKHDNLKKEQSNVSSKHH